MDELRHEALALAEALRSAPAGDGSPSRGLTAEERVRFVAFREILFRRGIYDPVLVRFDSATAPPATNEETAAELAKLAASL